MDLPKSHPRYESLRLRELIAEGYENGLVDRTGLIAHGRGEAFDYLLGECTHPEAEMAAKATAASILLARNPVISVNGNCAVLIPHELVKLAKLVPSKLEVNIFHRSELRLNKLVSFLEEHGAENVLGTKPDATIPGLDQPRALCTREGIYDADLVFVPLEDGDRAEALVKMGKIVIVVDLNPFSRSARYASITIVDNISRAINVIVEQVTEQRSKLDKDGLNLIIKEFNNEENLKMMIRHLKINEMDK